MFEEIICIAFAWRPWIMVIVAFAQDGAAYVFIENSNTNRQYLLKDFREAKQVYKLKLRDRLMKVLS